jgi:N-acyl-D-aspartate/D-glutamate deacylase
VARPDLVIRGGTVIDGTGSPARTVHDGMIVDVGLVDIRRHARDVE